ncbi:right-handed parallel beta-helix repeat-containing protein, partial [Maribacter sp.]|nr:right-handed parallel beta-helix repeat-containing protein [Maribacter sp.]
NFNINKGNTLRIEGPLYADLYQIFNKKVEFSRNSVSEIKAEWFGADHIAVNDALLSAGKIPVRISKNLSVRNAIVINSYQTLLINEGIKLVPTNDMRGLAVITNKNKSDTDISIHGGIIDGTAADKVAYDGVQFNAVSNSSIKNLSCINVHITASIDTGNIRLNNCDYVLIENCNAKGTWKMGILILNGSCNTVIGGKFYGTHDSAIGVINSSGTTIDGLFVDNCGTSDGSNMSLNAERLLVINNTSINAGGKRNGNGITLGHDNGPASYSVCMNNIVTNNRAKGIFIQGRNTINVVVSNNTVIGNGNQSLGTNSGGIAVYSGSSGHMISENIISGNRLGISLHKTSQNVVILNNQINSSTLYGIRNDGENSMIKDNYLFNTINVFNGNNHKNPSFINNITTSQAASSKE